MDSEQIHKKIGRNLLAVRKSRSLSLDQVAELTGVSKAMLGQIERGDSNPTISVLWKIVNGLHISFTSLIENEEPTVSVVHIEELTPFAEEDGDYRAYPVFPFNQQKKFEIYKVEIDAYCKHDSEAHNEGVEEYLLLVKGKLKLTIDQESYIINEGSAIHFSADRPHTYENLADETTSFHTTIFYSS
ncbi:helix-turn-helix domain-containing protein [Paenibacillus sp. KN14-4R]|uniref:helix-turn-helix domain-containing protein n=1 Tax=Paenibacillus sp. KN14-4R TaxID=3445773 RepID=UPI003F9F2714